MRPITNDIVYRVESKYLSEGALFGLNTPQEVSADGERCLLQIWWQTAQILPRYNLVITVIDKVYQVTSFAFYL